MGRQDKFKYFGRSVTLGQKQMANNTFLTPMRFLMKLCLVEPDT